MAWFRCFIRGENFPGQLVGEPGLVGFYLTRFVEATNADDAESTALQDLRAEPKLTPPPGYTPAGKACVFFEEIEECAADNVPDIQPGFVWHALEDADA